MDRRRLSRLLIGALALGLVGCVKKQDDAGKTPNPGTGATGAGSAVGAGSAAGAGSATGAIKITDVASAQAALGKRVRIEGTADNAKLGAIVLVGDLVVFCSDRPEGWDERNRPVIVEGELTYDAGKPAPPPGPNGEQSAGASGGSFRMACTVVTP